MNTSRIQEERVLGIQNRISEVRSRLMTLNDTVAPSVAGGQGFIAASSQESSRPHQSMNTQSLYSQPLQQHNWPTNTPQASYQAAGSAPYFAAATPQQPYFQSSMDNFDAIPVQFSPPRKGGTLIDNPEKKYIKQIDDQNRQIEFLQEQIDMMRQEAIARQQQRSVETFAGQRGDAMNASVTRPKHEDVSLQLSPGVSMTRGGISAGHNASVLGGSAQPPQVDRAQDEFAKMQAMLRAKLHAMNAPGPSPAVESSFQASPPLISNQKTAALDSRQQSFYSNATAAKQPTDVSHQMHPYDPVPYDSRQPSPPNHNAQILPGRRQGSGSQLREESSVQLTDDALSSRQGSVEASSSSQLLQKSQSTPHLAKLSGAEVFAVLRLRGLIQSQGATGEHLLPPALTHTMYLSHSEYSQLIQLREYLQQQQIQQQMQPSKAQRAKSPSAGHKENVVDQSTTYRPGSEAEVSAFEKHRQRLQAVRERAQSPSTAQRKGQAVRKD